MLADPKGRHGKDGRQFLEAVYWVLRTGAPWRDIPSEFGSWKGRRIGNALGFIITAGQQSDIGQAEALVENDCCDFWLADRGYDSDHFRKTLAQRGITPVIPGRKKRKVPIQYDKHMYKERNAVERFFGRIKEFRRIATRYDKTMRMFKGALLFASIIMWYKL